MMCGTLNNPTEREKEIFMEVICKKIVVGAEVGEEGTPHLQWVIVWYEKKSFSQAKALLCDRVHIEACKKPWEANATYCRKEDNVLRDEDNSRQGARTDITTFRDEILVKGKRTWDLINSDYIHQLAKFPRLECLIQNQKAKMATQGWRNVEVHVLWGDSGTGKTRKAFEKGDSYFLFQLNPEWWDGYDGEEYIIIDDFYGGLPFNRLLRLLDGYPCQVPIKGGSRWLEATTITITSNVHPDQWYSNIPEESKKGLKRRITSIIHMRGGLRTEKRAVRRLPGTEAKLELLEKASSSSSNPRD